jgi:AcrR family transcriptional regulator
MAPVLEVDRPPSFKERVKQERELEIVQVAREVFAEQGYEKASIDEIAERVGIGKGTVYLHFSNKEAIMCAVMRQGTRDVVEQCRKQTAAQHTTVEKLKAVLRVLTEHRYGSERLVRAISSEFPGFLVQKEKAAAISELSDLVTGLIQQGQAEGALRPNVDPRLGAVALLALVFVCPTHLEPLAKQELLDNVDQLYFHGISKEAEA